MKFVTDKVGSIDALRGEPVTSNLVDSLGNATSFEDDLNTSWDKINDTASSGSSSRRNAQNKETPELKENFNSLTMADASEKLRIISNNLKRGLENTTSNVCFFEGSAFQAECPLSNHVNECYSDNFDTDDSCTKYRKLFKDSWHFNWYGVLENNDCYVLSYKWINDATMCAIIRSKEGTKFFDSVPVKDVKGGLNPGVLFSYLMQSTTSPYFYPTFSPKTIQLLLEYDENFITNHYKFGVLYQKFGQTTEEEIFSNCSEDQLLNEFLNLLGSRVRLKNFSGFCAGLDVLNDDTGSESIYCQYGEAEVMFHVSTLLPYSPTNMQQVERKRHIGNDIFAIVFQERETPFCPDMIASKFLHGFIVVCPVIDDIGLPKYKVSVTVKTGVPAFGPPLPNPPLFTRNYKFTDWILCKLINGQTAACKSLCFSQILERNRSSQLNTLVNTLRTVNQETHDYLFLINRSGSSRDRFIDYVKKRFLRGQTQSEFTDYYSKLIKSHLQNNRNHANVADKSHVIGETDTTSSDEDHVNKLKNSLLKSFVSEYVNGIHSPENTKNFPIYGTRGDMVNSAENGNSILLHNSYLKEVKRLSKENEMLRHELKQLELKLMRQDPVI